MPRSREALLVASLTEPPSERGPAERSFPSAWALEWRADLLGEPREGDRAVSGGHRSIYTLRSRAEGGRGPNAATERRARLEAAAARHDFVDLEAARDLGADLLSSIPPERRIISWHGPSEPLSELRQRFDAMSATPARWYKLIPAADQPGEGIEPLALLESLGRDDVIAFASGEAGTWTRLLAPRLGAPVVYGHATGEPAAPGQPTLAALRDDYGLPDLPGVTRLFGIAGRPVLHSLSPRLHNLMFRKHGLAALYVPFHVPSFGDFWLDVVESGSLEFLGFELCGLSVTAPFKEIAIAVAGAVSPRAEHAGAANSLARRNGVWEAESTDQDGVVAPLLARGVRLERLATAVIGAGGAGRGAVDGLTARGAAVTLVNRSRKRGLRVAEELDVGFTPLDEFDPGRFDLLVNATPLGSVESELPFDPEDLRPSAVVVDLAYRHDGETALTAASRAAGLVVVGGREVLLHQAVAQFEWMNGRAFDLDLGRAALGLAAPASQPPPGEPPGPARGAR